MSRGPVRAQAAFERILIANRGEIARRIARTCRALGIETVAVFSDPDRSAPLLREVDAAVGLAGSSSADTYLRGDRLIEAAQRTEAQAIHPGYGFLAENAAFARAVADAGLVFIGPSAEVIAAMGAKVAAKERAAQAGLPVLPSRTLAPGDDHDAAARALGFPLLVKADAGGGGRGMRVVEQPGALGELVASARREAQAAFGDGTLYLERYLEAPRHLEVQVMGDHGGRVVHLYERECSLQRRFQKLLEEAPAPGLSAELRARLYDHALALARAIGYQSAGTVEFLLDAEGALYFLEMNTRLQVEHPVTECITGLDLVRLQIEVAQGAALPAQEEIPAPLGCALEVRLCAEDPSADFRPATGRFVRFEVSAGERVRVDSGVESGSEVTPHYDSLLAKVIASGSTRALARQRLVRALRGARLHGPETNRAFLVGVLDHPLVRSGAVITDFLRRHPPAELAERGEPDDVATYAVAAVLAISAHHRASAPVLGALPSGFRNLRSGLARQRLRRAGVEIDVAYSFERDRLTLEIDGAPRDVVLEQATPNLVDVAVGGVRRRFVVDVTDDRVFASSTTGGMAFDRVPRLPAPESEAAAGSLTAPLPGKVVRVHVAPGQAVERAQALVVLEAMKMEHTVQAPASGTVSAVLVAVGDQVEAGASLVAIDVAEPDRS